MRYGAIDIGTNTVRLLLYNEATGEKKKSLICTRLGEGLAATGFLSETAMERTAAAVSQYVKTALAVGCSAPIPCYATSAAREATNGSEFMKRLFLISGLSAAVITGSEEARYGYLGAAAGENAVVMDIGGGSTELICGESGKIVSSLSVKLGCVTSLERFIHNDTYDKGESRELLEFADEKARELCTFVLGAYRPPYLVGIGGTATQLAMLKLKRDDYSPEAVTGVRLTQKELMWMYSLLASMPSDKRKALRGMDPQRADVIVTGCAIAEAVLRNSCAGCIVVRDADGLDGFLAEKCGRNK